MRDRFGDPRLPRHMPNHRYFGHLRIIAHSTAWKARIYLMGVLEHDTASVGVTRPAVARSESFSPETSLLAATVLIRSCRHVVLLHPI
jgi:hypothetical protein